MGENRIRSVLALCCILASVSRGQSLLLETVSGPITAKETAAFKTYLLQKVKPPDGNDENVWVFGPPGKAIEACGLMYEATGDTAFLDRMIFYSDAALAGRNDLASAADGGRRQVWTGRIEPVWPPTADTVKPAGAGVETGQVLAHLAYCARLILEKPALWDGKVPIGDAQGFGATYKARALRFVREGDYVMDAWLLARFLRASEEDHYYFPEAPNTYKPGDPAPWNQAWMVTNALCRLAECHALLADSAKRVARYDAVARSNIAWFLANAKPAKSPTGSACRIWAYAYPSGVEDANHAAYDCEGLWIAYRSGRYGLKASDILPFANTYFDMIMAKVKDGVFAGRVDGTSGEGHAAGDNYVRDEYIYMTEFRPDMFQAVAEAESGTNHIAGSPPITARLLWEKNRRNAIALIGPGREGLRTRISPILSDGRLWLTGTPSIGGNEARGGETRTDASGRPFLRPTETAR